MSEIPSLANRLFLEKGIPEKHPSLLILNEPPKLEANFRDCFILALGVTGSQQGLRARFLGEQGMRWKGFENQEVCVGGCSSRRTRASRVRAEATEPVVSKCGFCWRSGKEPRGGTLRGVLGKYSTTNPFLKKKKALGIPLVHSFIQQTHTEVLCIRHRLCPEGSQFGGRVRLQRQTDNHKQQAGES